MFNKLDVDFSAIKNKPSTGTSLFVCGPTDTQMEFIFFTNGTLVWEGTVMQSFLVDSGVESQFQQLLNLVLKPNPSVLFIAKPFPSSEIGFVLHVKSQMELGGQRRLCELSLRPVSHSESFLHNLLSQLFRDQSLFLQEISKLTQQRTEESAKAKQYATLLASKISDKEASMDDLMKRFLPILNTKKERIRELEEALKNTTTTTTTSEYTRQDSRRSELSDQEEESTPPPSAAKRKLKVNPMPAAPSQEVKKKRTEKKIVKLDTDSDLPPGWKRTTSRSKPGQVCYVNEELGKRQFNFPSYSSGVKQMKPTEQEEDSAMQSFGVVKVELPQPPPVMVSEKVQVEMIKQKDEDSFLDEFF